MGNTAIRFRRAVKSNDEATALRLLEDNVLLPSVTLLPGSSKNTALHYAARAALVRVVDRLLSHPAADVTVTNAAGATALHLACAAPNEPTKRAAIARAIVQTLLLREPVESLLDAPDVYGCTALHFAARNGLYACSEVLAQAGGDVTKLNADGFTPADVAEKAEHMNVAALLEAHVLYGATRAAAAVHSPSRAASPHTDGGMSPDASSLERLEQQLLLGKEGTFRGLPVQQVQALKDELLVNTTDALGLPMACVEALLRQCQWSKNALLQDFLSDPDALCERAGIPPIAVLAAAAAAAAAAAREGETAHATHECCVCSDDVPAEELPRLSCGHHCCRGCLEQYVRVKIREGDSLRIACPVHLCGALLPVELVDSLASADLRKRYQQYDINAFVSSHPSLKWCPHPSCGRAVTWTHETAPDPHGHSVECGAGHFFCWSCGGDPHEPCTCAHWRQWLEAMQSGDAAAAAGASADIAATAVWLATHSKQCPACQAFIEKNDGCNHMTCRKCKHEFCWVCLGPWREHGQATGGYFRCNKFDDQRAAESKQQETVRSAEQRSKITHHLLRFQEHDRSRSLETEAMASVPARADALTALPEALRLGASAGAVAVLELSARELCMSRLALRNSYAAAYFIPSGDDRTAFESAQAELEVATERLSQLCGRTRVRGSRVELARSAVRAQNQRRKLLKLAAPLFGRSAPPEPQLQRVRSVAARRAAAAALDDIAVEFEGDGQSPVPYVGNFGGLLRRQSSGESTELAPAARAANRSTRWTCSACTFINDMWRTHCQMCETEGPAAAQPAPALPAPALPPPSRAVQSAALAAALLAATTGSVRRLARASSSAASGGSDSGVQGDSWACSRCTLLNAATRAQCAACDGARASLV